MHSTLEKPPVDRLAYSIAEAMQATGISRGHFYKLLHEGHLTRRKVGKRTLILREDLQNFLRCRPTAPWRGEATRNDGEKA
jgi:excisionase family DNA binding protein